MTNRFSAPAWGRPLSRRAFCAGAALLLAAPAVLASAGCAGAGPATKADDWERALAEGSPDAFLFTDSCGREVALPRQINAVSPSGAYAQLLLCTLAPEKLVSLSSRFSDKQLEYLDARIAGLPVLGRFYGKNGDMSYEEIIKMSPDVIIDIGEPKENIAADMDALQEQTGLPVIFVQATLDEVARAYRTLGGLLGCEERAEELASYVDAVFDFAAQHRDAIAAEGLRVLYSTGPYGYEVKEAGSVHGAVLDAVGVTNMADLGGVSSTEVSPEQVMLWAPDVVLLSASSGFYDYIFDDPTWANIPAVQSGRVYEVPDEPYEWMDKPPSVQTVLGILWLGNLLYPEVYDFDMAEETRRFYELLWSCELSEAKAAEFLAHSTLAR